MVTERTQVFTDVQTCKGETVKGLHTIHGYKNLKKRCPLTHVKILVECKTTTW
jgi:hypothetical protein